MKVTREKTENSQAFLTIEMEPAEVEKSLEGSYNRLVKKTRVPGFRKGKAPRKVLEGFIGKESLLEDTINDLLPKVYKDAIKQQEIEPYAQAQVEVAQTDPVIFKATVPLPPTVEIGDYHQIKIESKPVELSDDNVNAAIEQLRHQHANWEPVERPVEFNDLVIMDIDSNVDGKPFLNRKIVQYQVVKDLPFPAPGFAEQLPGMKRDEEKEFKLKFPEDDTRAELAGKEPAFKIKINEVKKEVLPELDDAFAREVNSEFGTVAAMRERVSTDLKARVEEEVRRDFEEKVIEAAVELAPKIEFPPIMVEMEIDHLIRGQLQQWQMDAKGLQDYLKSINKTVEEMREDLRPLATKRTQQALVLGKVTEQEKIEASDAEIDAEIEKMTANAAENDRDKFKQYLSSPQSRESIRQVLMTRKTIQRLVEIAGGTGETGK